MISSRRLVGLVLLVLSALLLLDQTDMLDFGRTVTRVWALLWPAVLLLAGLWLLWGRRGAPRPGGEDAVSAFALFSGRELVSSSPRFRGGSLTALFGGVDLDLRGARLDPEGAEIDVVAIFGGVDVVVPPGWRVQMDGPAIFGGNANDSGRIKTPADDAPVLRVHALSVFGGVEVEDRRIA